MKIYRKDVSDGEVQAFMAPFLAELMKGVVPRVRKEPEAEPEEEVKERPRTNRRRAPGQSMNARVTSTTTEKTRGAPPHPTDNSQPDPVLTAAERELLESVSAEPNLHVTDRSKRLGWSSSKMNDVKEAALLHGVVEQFRVNWGKEHGGNVTLLALTMEGYGVLGKLPANKRPRNITPEHWYLQTAGCASFNRQGLEAEIEKNLNGKRADICVNMNGFLMAVEFELSPNHAVPNIVEDLKAGFDRVVSVCKNRLVEREVSRRLALYEGYEDIKDRVEVRVLGELQWVKDLCGK